jgi:hypothetical protein
MNIKIINYADILAAKEIGWYISFIDIFNEVRTITKTCANYYNVHYVEIDVNFSFNVINVALELIEGGVDLEFS